MGGDSLRPEDARSSSDSSGRPRLSRRGARDQAPAAVPLRGRAQEHEIVLLCVAPLQSSSLVRYALGRYGRRRRSQASSGGDGHEPTMKRIDGCQIAR
jgi:hypothetical protein